MLRTLIIYAMLLSSSLYVNANFDVGSDAHSSPTVKRVATNAQEKVISTGKGSRFATATPQAIALPNFTGQNQGQQDSTAYDNNKDASIAVATDCDDLQQMIANTDATVGESGNKADRVTPNKYSVSAPYGPKAISASALNTAKAQAALKEKLRAESKEKKMMLHDIANQNSKGGASDGDSSIESDPLTQLMNPSTKSE